MERQRSVECSSVEEADPEWIMGSCVFSRWPVAVVCANYSLREARCLSRDVPTERRALGDTHSQTHTHSLSHSICTHPHGSTHSFINSHTLYVSVS